MKYVIIIISISVLFFQCKEKKSKENVLNEIDSTSIQNTSKSHFPLNDISITEVENALKMKNDTLYIVNFWATWCPPCRDEIPFFVQAQEINKNNKFKLIFISLDQYTTRPSVVDFVLKAQMKNTYILKSDNQEEIGKLVPELNDGIPVTVFLKKGKSENTIGGFIEADFKLKINEWLTSN